MKKVGGNMKKLRTGLEKRIEFVDKEKNIVTQLVVRVITRLKDLKTNKEIIFLNYDDENENRYKTQFIGKLGKVVEELSSKKFDGAFKEKDIDKYAILTDLYIDNFVKIIFLDDNTPKIKLNEELLEKSPFRIEYDVEFHKLVGNYYVAENEIEEDKIISEKEFISELNKIDCETVREQKKDIYNLYYFESEIETDIK
jgi:hypothetical protein